MNTRMGRGRGVRALTGVVVSALLMLACATLASAAWPDLPLERLGPYGVSEYDLEQISQGYPTGSGARTACSRGRSSRRWR